MFLKLIFKSILLTLLLSKSSFQNAIRNELQNDFVIKTNQIHKLIICANETKTIDCGSDKLTIVQANDFTSSDDICSYK
jgi:hypothetical protein